MNSSFVASGEKQPSILNYFRPKNESPNSINNNGDSPTVDQSLLTRNEINTKNSNQSIADCDNAVLLSSDEDEIIDIDDSDEDSAEVKEDKKPIGSENEKNKILYRSSDKVSTQLPELQHSKQSLQGSKSLSNSTNPDEKSIEKSTTSLATELDLTSLNFINLNDFLEVELNCSLDEDCDQLLENSSIDQDYKLNLFKYILNTILNDQFFSHLFNDFDWNVIERFTTLSLPAQKLFIRLMLRKRQWIKNSQIRYPDIEKNLQQYILNELVGSNFLFSGDKLNNINDALKVLDLFELKVLARSLIGVKKTGPQTKSAIQDAILRHIKSSQSIRSHFVKGSDSGIESVVLKKIIAAAGGSCYLVNDEFASVFSRMSLLFFPPDVHEEEEGVGLSSNIYDLLREDIGEIKYPSYNLNRKTVVFKSREDLLEYEKACSLETYILKTLEGIDCEQNLMKLVKEAKDFYQRLIKKGCLRIDRQLPPFLRCYTAGYVIMRCLSHCISALEKHKKHSEAADLLKIVLGKDVYCMHRKGKWYTRLVINLEKHLQKPREAASVIVKALKDKDVKRPHHYGLYLRAKRLLERLKMTIPQYDEYDFKIKEITIEHETLKCGIDGRKFIFILKEPNDVVKVLPEEDIAALYYKKKCDFVKSAHCEGIIYNTLFSIFFWDIIYCDKAFTKDAFYCQHQTIPLDLNSDHFYLRRKDMITSRLSFIRNSSYDTLSKKLEDTWNNNFGVLSLVNWDKCSLEELKEILLCMKRDTLAAICERLALDYRSNRSGFPDLLVWNHGTRTIKAVEVKGPHDQHSPKQSLWLYQLNNFGLSAEVCYVKEGKKSCLD